MADMTLCIGDQAIAPGGTEPGCIGVAGAAFSCRPGRSPISRKRGEKWGTPACSNGSERTA